MKTPSYWCPQEPSAWLEASGAVRWRKVPDNKELRHAVIANPDDDGPRRQYATWMSAHEDTRARRIGAFISAQLRVAAAWRTNRRANVNSLRSWTSDGWLASSGTFRAGGSLRPWFVSSLQRLPWLAWPQIFRGFVERVWMRARTFMRYAPLLFELAPIRSLVLVNVSEVVDALAACVHLRRIRSLSLPRYGLADTLSDRQLGRLLSSPYLSNLTHLRLVHQRKLTSSSYADAIKALPLLSSFEVLLPQPDWEFYSSFDAASRCERIVTIDSAVPAVRSGHWIESLEQKIGRVPCLHPEFYYGPEPDLESILVNPIALDPRVGAQRARALRVKEGNA
jgi:uncharacterized protein (TIGR02996 family)